MSKFVIPIQNASGFIDGMCGPFHTYNEAAAFRKGFNKNNIGLKALEPVEHQEAAIIGLDRQGQTFNFLDEAFIQTIERRILSGATMLNDVMSDEESQRLSYLNVKIQIKVTPMPKFTSTLADDLVFNEDKQAIVDKKIEARVKAKIRTARRFVLTEDAAVRVGQAIRAYPEMLVEHGVFARTPFETCWIELPAYKFHEAIVPESSTPEADLRVGYLFDGDTVYVVAQRDGNVASVSPLIINLHNPLSFREELKLSQSLELSRYTLDYFFWGKTMADELPADIRRGLRNQHSFSVEVREQYRNAFSGEDFLRFSAGEVRNIIGLLLMINQPSSILRETAVERSRVMTKKGSRVLMGHSVITIDLDKRSHPNRILRSTPISRRKARFHDVANHWCHDKVARTKGFNLDDPRTHGKGDHAHEWVQAEDGSLRFTCSICGGKRWRRIMKGRGDKSRGMVAQERVVKATSNKAENDH